MHFRPCIDIHNGKVKQIVGGSLLDSGNQAKENYVSEQDAAFYANLYRSYGLSGGHVIILNPEGSEYYSADLEQAKLALAAHAGSLQIGGGIHAGNAGKFLEYGASHVIVTSYVFQNGTVRYDRIDELVREVGREHLVLDLSCRKRDGKYYIVTDRWQTFTEEIITTELLDRLSEYCDEFLIHAVDAEGKASGIEQELVSLLGAWNGLPITYAGGVGTFDHLKQLKELGQDRLDVTIGSALDLFGGKLRLEDVLAYMGENN